MTSTGRGRTRWAALAATATAVAALAASCSGGSGEDAADAGAAADTAGLTTESRVADLDAPTQGGGASAGPGRTANRPTVRTRAVIRKGEIALVTEQMNAARAQIEGLLARHGGYVSSEDTVNDRAGRPERSVLVLRVPEPAFDEVMAELADIGRPERADRSSEDVTTEVIDVDTRVATAEASLARLQRFLRQARDVDDMIRLESEIATRQAELESLKAQQKYLADQTSMSTVEVRLRTPASPPPPPAEGDQGFLAGLGAGWSALMTVLLAASTVLGALLPFTVAAALLGIPAWLLVRAAHRRRSSEPAPTTASEAG
ncbi:MAG TPA: DUF4349 domain-containing protein [Nocardioidaceae bacterium]